MRGVRDSRGGLTLTVSVPLVQSSVSVVGVDGNHDRLSLVALQREAFAAALAEPKVLRGMRVRRSLTLRMTKTKQSPRPIFIMGSTVWICAPRNHESLLQEVRASLSYQ
jgi:hypothetical protein